MSPCFQSTALSGILEDYMNHVTAWWRDQRVLQISNSLALGKPHDITVGCGYRFNKAHFWQRRIQW